MKFKGTQKPSLIILGRTTLALMLLTIAAVSFGAGYLTGYQFTAPSNDDRPVMSAGSRMVLPPEEKRVLEPTPAPAPAQQVAQAQQQTVAQTPKQTEQPLISVKPSAPEASTPPAQTEQKVAMAEKPAPAKPAEQKPEETKKAPARQPAPEAQTPEKQNPADLKKQSGKKAPAAPAKSAEGSAKAGKKKSVAKAHAAAPKKGGYAVQFGAFEETPKAEHLKKELAAKGIKAYILPKGKTSSYARVRAGSFAKREQAVHYAEVCRTKGFEGFITK